MISKNASEVKRGSTPNLEKSRGRDVDAMTVDGLEYSVTATVNGYTARIADGDTTLWVQRVKEKIHCRRSKGLYSY